MHDLLGPLVNLLAVAVGGWLLHRLKTPTDRERAELLTRMATEAAALILSLNPGASWATLIDQVVQQLATAAGIPTHNRPALQRAAAAALTQLGKVNG